MSTNSKIEWLKNGDGAQGATWNPITGCTPISEGCSNCYAKRMARRFAGRYGYPEDDPFKVTFHPDQIEKPLKWKKPRRIFVCSMGDILHNDVQVDWIDEIMGTMVRCPQHTFMVLTKRPENFEEKILAYYHNKNRRLFDKGFPDNVFVGVTAENQKRADERIPILLTIPAVVRFVSFEPLLSNIDPQQCSAISWGPCGGGGESGPVEYDGMPNIDWAIVGAETGPKKRAMDIEWARNIRDWCNGFGISFFFKKDSAGNHELDGRAWEEFPK